MSFLIDPAYGNHNGDNLTESEDDEFDENAYYNWVNHPIRQLYDNPRNSFHASGDPEQPSFPEDENDRDPWMPVPSRNRRCTVSGAPRGPKPQSRLEP